MKFQKKFIPIIVLITVSLLLFVSAGGQTGGTSAPSGPSTLSANDRLPSIIKYPLVNAPKITWWTPLSTHVSANYPTLSDSFFGKGLVERTGVPVEFIHPGQGMELEQFNLLIASGRLPDIVEYSWTNSYNGGADAAIRNQVMLSLNSVMDNWCPDFKKFIADNPSIDNGLKTDEGNYYGFPMIQIAERLAVTAGPFVRQDWLDELGLQRPETIDELTSVLRAFKERKGAVAPMALIGGNTLNNIFYQGSIVGAYRTHNNMFQENGKVSYGPALPAYKEAVRKMNEWYREGLLDQSFASGVQRDRDANILNSNSGVSFGMCSSSMDMLNRGFKDNNHPTAKLRAFRYPVLSKGERSMVGHRYYPVDMGSVSVVNPRGPNVETAVKLLNYGYSQPGQFFYNYGMEGVSYNMINGYPTMVPEILNPSSGSVGAAWSRYARAPYNGPLNVHAEYHEQYLAAPELDEALAIWRHQDMQNHMIPPVSVTVEESRVYNRIKTDLDSYVLEWTVKAITGTVNVEEFDTVYLRTVREIGVEQAVAIQQAAYNRFINRR